MKQKLKLVFILPDLTSGGAERVMSFIADNISKEHFDTSLWLAGTNEKTAYNIDSIPVTYFNKNRVLHAIPNFITSFIKHKPDIVIGSIAHVNASIALSSIFFPKIKFIGREANVMSVVKNYNHTTNRIGNLVPITASYKFLDLLICQSKDMYQDMKLKFQIPEKKLRIINNPITDHFVLKTYKPIDLNCIRFVTVAQFKKQKGHERILRALAKLSFNFHYTIIGKGPEEANILSLIERLNLKSKITHITFTKEVPKQLANSDFFLQGSYVEGFPNCLIESCAVGTPILAYEAPGGLNEIIEPEINGLIAKNDDEFIENIYHAVKSLNWNPENIRDSVYNKFNKDKILKQYEDLILEVYNS